MNAVFKEKFNKLFWQCIANGFSTVEARDYSSLELTGKLYHAQESQK